MNEQEEIESNMIINEINKKIRAIYPDMDDTELFVEVFLQQWLLIADKQVWCTIDEDYLSFHPFDQKEKARGTHLDATAYFKLVLSPILTKAIEAELVFIVATQDTGTPMFKNRYTVNESDLFTRYTTKQALKYIDNLLKSDSLIEPIPEKE